MKLPSTRTPVAERPVMRIPAPSREAVDDEAADGHTRPGDQQAVATTGPVAPELDQRLAAVARLGIAVDQDRAA